MSAAAVTDGEEAPLSLQSLRDEGAQHFDPVRFRYLEALAQRTAGAPDPVRRHLEGRLNTALADHAERFKQAQQAANDEVVKLSAQRPDLARELRRLLKAGDYRGVRRLGAQAAFNMPSTPLAALNQHIHKAVQDGAERDGQGRIEMKSVRRFREVWSRIAAVDQVDQALGRGPENAGPLNSHTLVLRSLALMRDLSPDYLRRFVAHLDALFWLDQAGQKHEPVEVKPVRRSRQKK